MTVYLHLEGDTVEDVSFEAQGCAISKASASLMTEAIKGKTLGEIEPLFEKVHAMLTTPQGEEVETEGHGGCSAGSVPGFGLWVWWLVVRGPIRR